MTFSAEALGLRFGATGPLGVEGAVVGYDTPVGRDILVPGGGVFLRGLGGDAEEDAGAEGTGGGGVVVFGEAVRIWEVVASFPLGIVAHDRIDLKGSGDQKRAGAEGLAIFSGMGQTAGSCAFSSLRRQDVFEVNLLFFVFVAAGMDCS